MGRGIGKEKGCFGAPSVSAWLRLAGVDASADSRGSVERAAEQNQNSYRCQERDTVLPGGCCSREQELLPPASLCFTACPQRPLLQEAQTTFPSLPVPGSQI